MVTYLLPSECDHFSLQLNGVITFLRCGVDLPAVVPNAGLIDVGLSGVCVVAGEDT
jgi:hypothetical protein